MARIIVIGEGMLELSRNDETWNLGYGGDTLNTAIHLARLGNDVAFVSAIGSDPLSAELRQKWSDEGLDLSFVPIHPSRSAGLYAISTDSCGERSFAYWRENSAAREMFSLFNLTALKEAVCGADLFIFSLISLAILPPKGREKLLLLAKQVRAAGGTVAFDGNYRPRLWSSPKEAISNRNAAIKCADIGLPTLEDECLLSGQNSAEIITEHWTNLGCLETVVKLGAQGCRLPDGQIVPPPAKLNPIDTSGAGDAFNAGYLSTRHKGASHFEAAIEGHKLAGWCVMRRGAIPQRDAPADIP